ncbi:MAG: alkanesulfonate transporter substrate-binding subunit [Candidatus Methanolliviera sp. GoM_oil]|nr:MAG: alkanesulfonate transporter substrate-binding subunit [Candidatus Methanolliviera sp. GoM_oil]
MKRRSLILIAIGLLVVILAAYVALKPDGGMRYEEITIGYQPSTHQVAEMIAMEKGWWEDDLKEFGVEEVDDKVFPSGPPEMQAMLGDEIDVAYVGVAPAITAIGQGLDAKIVASVNTQGSAIVLIPKIAERYKDPQSLKGLKIATFLPGSVQDTLLRTWLKENGINPDKDLDIVPMGPGDAITAIESERVDGVFLPSPSPSNIVLDGKGKIVVWSGEMCPDHACCVLLASGDLIRGHPEIVEEIVKTHIKATNYIFEEMDDSIEICSDKTGIPEDVVRYSVQAWDGRWVSDPRPIVGSSLEYARYQYDLGYIQKILGSDELFDLKFYEKV